MRASGKRPVVLLTEDEPPLGLDRCDSRALSHDIVASAGDPVVPGAGQ